MSSSPGPAQCVGGAECPPRKLDGAALGRQRLGVNLISRIATLREEGRLPIRSIQWYLRTVHQLSLSVGAIVSAIHQTAQQAQPAVAGMVDRIRASPVVHADETGWRQNGNNGYVWTFSTPTERYFLRRGRGKAVVDEALGESFSGVLVSDFYAAYHHYDGPKQRCWAHLLRDIHDLVALYPKDTSLAQWAAAVHQLYVEARSFTHPQARRRRTAQLAWERQLLAISQPGGTGQSLRRSCLHLSRASSLSSRMRAWVCLYAAARPLETRAFSSCRSSVVSLIRYFLSGTTLLLGCNSPMPTEYTPRASIQRRWTTSTQWSVRKTAWWW